MHILSNIYEEMVQNIASARSAFTLQENRRLLNLGLVNQVKVLAIVPCSRKE